MWIRFDPRAISVTLPTRFLAGTVPQMRESVNDTDPLRPPLTRKTDQPLHERPADAATHPRCRRRLEDDEVAALRPRVAVRANGELVRLRRDERRSADQWKEMRLGGQYVAKTSPIKFPRGTRPHTRESHDELRLSPIIKYIPFGIVVRPTMPGRSARM